MPKIHTHYDTLSVVRNAPPEVIRAAYKILSQKYHPDRNTDNPNATAIMAKINEAYAVLSEPEKRKKYDRWLAEQEASATQQDEPARKPEPDKKTNQTKPPPPKSETSSSGKWFLYGFIAFVVWLFFKTPNSDSVQKEVTPSAAVTTTEPPPANYNALDSKLAKSRQKAEQGDAEAQWLLGYLYEYGKEGIGEPLNSNVPITKDDVQAVYWYRKAAEQGNANAQNGLGRAYALGKGVVKDDAQAAYWHHKAAEQGDANSQLKLGAAYALSSGVTKDDVQALYWLRKSAEQGNKDAQDLLKTF